MSIAGKRIDQLDSITPTLQTVLPAVYINGTEVSDTAGRISLQDIKSLIGGGGGGGGIQSISWYDNNVGTELTIMDIPDTTVVNVYKNGVLLREGVDNDYTVAGNVITFSVSLEATDTICVIMGDPGMQLNLGDLSGAVVELSNIITAGKKQIANSLVNKGVTDIKYTDSLSKMADAIDLLPTGGVGLDKNIPLLVLPSSLDGVLYAQDSLFSTVNSRNYYKLPGKDHILYRNYGSNNTTAGIQMIDISDKTFSGNNPVDFTISIQAIRTQLGVTDSELTISTHCRMFYDASTESFYFCTVDHKLVKVKVTFNSILSNSTWVASIIVDNITGISWNSSYYTVCECLDVTKNKALLRYTYNNYFYIMNLTTGACTQVSTSIMPSVDMNNTPILYGYNYNNISALIKKSYDTYNATALTVTFINWDNIDASLVLTTSDTFHNSVGFFVDYEGAKIHCGNFGEVDLVNRTYTQGINVVRNPVGNGKSYSGSRIREIARIILPNNDIFQLDTWCVPQVFTSQKVQRLLPDNRSGQVAMKYGSYGMGLPYTDISYMTLGHILSIDNRLLIISQDGNDVVQNTCKIYEPIIDYDRFIAWPVTRNNQTTWMIPLRETVSYDTFMSDESPLLRSSIQINVDI